MQEAGSRHAITAMAEKNSAAAALLGVLTADLHHPTTVVLVLLGGQRHGVTVCACQLPKSSHLLCMVGQAHAAPVHLPGGHHAPFLRHTVRCHLRHSQNASSASEGCMHARMHQACPGMQSGATAACACTLLCMHGESEGWGVNASMV